MRSARSSAPKRRAETAEGSRTKKSRKEPGKSSTAAAERKKLSEINAADSDAGVVIPK